MFSFVVSYAKIECEVTLIRDTFSINGEEKLKENATCFADFAACFAQTSNWNEDLIYGDQLIFKVCFDGGIVPFNNAELFSVYETIDGQSWYFIIRLEIKKFIIVHGFYTLQVEEMPYLLGFLDSHVPAIDDTFL